jgi:MFS transporter, ACS family, hexuronate transporter
MPQPAVYAPGWQKWIAPTAIMLCSLLSYIDRQVLAVLSPTILQETGMTASDYGWVVASFSIFYTIGNPLLGAMLDYIGLRKGMLIAVGIWTVASMSHAWVGSMLGFAIARAVLGFGEGAAFPGAYRTAADALPPNKRMRGTALGYSGASLGAILTPLAVRPIAAMYGWRPAFLITGLLGLLWLALWLAVARPPYLPDNTKRATKIAWPNVLERRFWLTVSSFGLGAVALGVVAYFSPLYLSRVYHLSQDEVLKVVWIPTVGWELGYFFWGWVNDKWNVEMKDRAAPRRIFILLTVLTLPILLATVVHSLPAVLALLFWATFIADGFVVTTLRVGARIYPPAQIGLVAGIGSSSWGLVQAIVQPVYGKLVDLNMFNTIFISMAVLPLIGTLIWLWLSRDEDLWA